MGRRGSRQSRRERRAKMEQDDDKDELGPESQRGNSWEGQVSHGDKGSWLVIQVTETCSLYLTA